LESLRERMIGAEMFGRPVDYDTSNDAVVRVRATEVRKRLALYYGEAAPTPIVRFELLPGSYVPEFHWSPPAEVKDEAVETVPPRADPTVNQYAVTEDGLKFLVLEPRKDFLETYSVVLNWPANLP
jgi:hypothetical protein